MSTLEDKLVGSISKPTGKRTVAKKTTAKKPVAKKTVAKKTTAKKPVAKKTTKVSIGHPRRIWPD